MKRIHLLRYEGEPGTLRPLVEAIATDGGRVGWLDMGWVDPVPPSLSEVAELDVLRAVAVGPERSLAIKPLRGRPALGDLLREHFLGCRLVIVVGDVEAPRLRAEGDAWTVDGRSWSPTRLAAELRRPKPFS